MKKLFQALIFIFCFSIFAFAQVNQPCPKIEVYGPSSLVNAGETMTFSAIVDGKTPESNLEFEWTVSAGTIIDQQGKPEIRVMTTEEMAATNLTATVKVKGLPENCSSEASEIAVIQGMAGCGAPMNQYGKKSLNDERGSFDNFFVTLQNNVRSRGYILFEIEKNEKPEDVKNRISKLMKHFDFRGVSRSLVIVDVCYADKNQTSFWIVPDGAKLPDYGECERVDIDWK